MLLIALNILVFKTRMGMAMRATPQDKTMSALVAIGSNKIVSYTLLPSVRVLQEQQASSWVSITVPCDMTWGSLREIKDCPRSRFGWYRELYGAMLGGLIIGMVESFGAGYISGQYKDVFAFIILIAVLYFKPTGIIGQEYSMIQSFRKSGKDIAGDALASGSSLAEFRYTSDGTLLLFGRP